MSLIKNITELIGIKITNIIISLIVESMFVNCGGGRNVNQKKDKKTRAMALVVKKVCSHLDL
ncbi:hypothetical protein SALIVB_0472 [Streptococcus salivarius CCHSS3]|jgi:hypothetical protein|nr:hypothetical protein SALIVB_0472 [Streptococcus salivarius CCHSS3]